MPYNGIYKRFESEILDLYRDDMPSGAISRALWQKRRSRPSHEWDTPSAENVRYILRKNGVLPRRSPRPEKNYISERDLSIYQSRHDGLTLKAVGEIHKLSKDRIRQIVIRINRIRLDVTPEKVSGT